MAPVTRACPKCGTLLAIPQPPPAKVMCPKCAAQIKLKAPTPVLETARAGASSSPTATPTVTFASAGLPKAPQGHTLLHELARGGLGVVYLARHEMLQDIRAVKRPLSDSAVNREALLARFRREVQAVGAVRHDHVLRAYDAGSDEAGPFLTMEYLDGAPLSRTIARRPPIPAAVACELIRQAALGLQAAHERGIIHRDVKPSNLMLARANSGMARVVVIDWGLAKSTKEASSLPGESLTLMGSTMGTIDYVAPEQIANAAAADARADIYSLGATFYTLLASKPPFHGRPDADKLAAQLRDPFPPLESLRPDVPPQVLAIVRRMTEKDPAKRFQTLGEVAAALQPFSCGAASPGLIGLLADGPSPAGATQDTADVFGKPTELASMPRPTPVAKAGRSWIWMGFAGIGLAAAAIVAAVFLRGNAGKNGDDSGKGTPTPNYALLATAPKGPILPGDPPGVIGKISGAGYNSAHIGNLFPAPPTFLPDGKRAVHREFSVGGSSGSRLLYLDLTEKILRPVPNLDFNGLGMLAISADGKRMAISDMKVVQLADGATYKKEGVIGLGEMCTAVALSPDGQLLISAELNGKKGRVRFTDAEKRLPLNRPDMEFDIPVVSIQFSLDGQRFLTTNAAMNGYRIADSDDKKIRIWNAKDSTQVRELAGHPHAPSAAAFFADGKRVFSASPLDATLRVWNVDEGDKKNVGTEAKPPILAGEKMPNANPEPQQHHPRHITAIGFWPWGRAITGYRFGGMTLWDLETGKAIAEFPSPSDAAHAYVAAVAISPDGHHALSFVTDGSAYLYRLPPPPK